MAYYKFNEDKNKNFINPYHFSPLGEIVRKPAGQWEDPEDSHTGVIHCTLTARTPLIIPEEDTPTEDNPDHKRYTFMKINGKYAIPASSLRGPIRSMYEALTDSCFSTVKDKEQITNRSKNPFEAGLILKRGDMYELYRAERYLIFVKDYIPKWKKANPGRSIEDKVPSSVPYFNLDDTRNDHGREVYFIASNEGYEKRGHEIGKYVEDYLFPEEVDKASIGNYEKGYVFCGERIGNKHFESIFKLKGLDKRCKSDQIKNALSGLRTIKKIYEDPKINRNIKAKKENEKHNSYKHLKNHLEPADGQYFPIWYKYAENGKLYFSLASIGRMAYENTMTDVLKGFDVCKNRNAVCPACALFGMKNQGEDSGGIGSHIRFTDAVITKEPVENVNIKREELNELASPRISYLPFYLKKGYEIKTDRNDVKYTEGYDASNVEIMGRKQYFHHQPVEEIYHNIKGENGDKEALNERNSRMEMIKDREFAFDVYYDCITKDQLDELLWLLCLGENDKNSDKCFKIGHGKPFGFGSVKVTIDGIEERQTGAECYSVVRITDTALSEMIDTAVAKMGESKKNSISRVKKFIDFNGAGENNGVIVRYPYVVAPRMIPSNKVNDYASHKWFSENYPLRNKAKIRTLPSLQNNDLSLPALEILPDDRDNDNYHGRSDKGPRNGGYNNNGKQNWNHKGKQGGNKQWNKNK